MTTNVTAPAGARHSRPARGGQAVAGERLIEADPTVPDIVDVWGNDFPGQRRARQLVARAPVDPRT